MVATGASLRWGVIAPAAGKFPLPPDRATVGRMTVDGEPHDLAVWAKTPLIAPPEPGDFMSEWNVGEIHVVRFARRRFPIRLSAFALILPATLLPFGLGLAGAIATIVVTSIVVGAAAAWILVYRAVNAPLVLVLGKDEITLRGRGHNHTGPRTRLKISLGANLAVIETLGGTITVDHLSQDDVRRLAKLTKREHIPARIAPIKRSR